ncbi:unnamed protein product, partial [Brassica oleracea]
MPPRLALDRQTERTTLRIKRHVSSAKTRIKRQFGGVKDYNRVNAIGVMVMNTLDVMLNVNSNWLVVMNGEDSVHVSSSHVPLYGTPRSEDPHLGNEQRSRAFWQRIAAYFAASPKIRASERRESSHCKQRWHKINDQVGKFFGAFEAASSERTSGQNDNDVLKQAHEIFFNNHKKKFTLEHA